MSNIISIREPKSLKDRERELKKDAVLSEQSAIFKSIAETNDNISSLIREINVLKKRELDKENSTNALLKELIKNQTDDATYHDIAKNRRSNNHRNDPSMLNSSHTVNDVKNVGSNVIAPGAMSSTLLSALSGGILNPVVIHKLGIDKLMHSVTTDVLGIGKLGLSKLLGNGQSKTSGTTTSALKVDKNAQINNRLDSIINILDKKNGGVKEKENKKSSMISKLLGLLTSSGLLKALLAFGAGVAAWKLLGDKFKKILDGVSAFFSGDGNKNPIFVPGGLNNKITDEVGKLRKTIEDYYDEQLKESRKSAEKQYKEIEAKKNKEIDRLREESKLKEKKITEEYKVREKKTSEKYNKKVEELKLKHAELESKIKAAEDVGKSRKEEIERIKKEFGDEIKANKKELSELKEELNKKRNDIAENTKKRIQNLNSKAENEKAKVKENKAAVENKINAERAKDIDVLDSYAGKNSIKKGAKLIGNGASKVVGFLGLEDIAENVVEKATDLAIGNITTEELVDESSSQIKQSFGTLANEVNEGTQGKSGLKFCGAVLKTTARELLGLVTGAGDFTYNKIAELSGSDSRIDLTGFFDANRGFQQILNPNQYLNYGAGVAINGYEKFGKAINEQLNVLDPLNKHNSDSTNGVTPLKTSDGASSQFAISKVIIEQLCKDDPNNIFCKQFEQTEETTGVLKDIRTLLKESVETGRSNKDFGTFGNLIYNNVNTNNTSAYMMNNGDNGGLSNGS